MLPQSAIDYLREVIPTTVLSESEEEAVYDYEVWLDRVFN